MRAGLTTFLFTAALLVGVAHADDVWTSPARGLRQTLILAVIDGRTSASVGMSLEDEARLMIEMGAWRALNLDGGGSSEMVIAGEGGVQNHPSDGEERVVANHLGLVLSGDGLEDAGAPSWDAALIDAAHPRDAAAAASDILGGCACAPPGPAPPMLPSCLLAALSLGLHLNRRRCRLT